MSAAKALLSDDPFWHLVQACEMDHMQPQWTATGAAHCRRLARPPVQPGGDRTDPVPPRMWLRVTETCWKPASARMPRRQSDIMQCSATYCEGSRANSDCRTSCDRRC